MKTSYLIVDLDDTLVRTDTLFDMLIQVLKRQPWYLFALGWILLSKGISHLKHVMATICPLDPATLPYRSDIVGLCRSHKDKSAENKVFLVSAADDSIVQSIAKHLEIFDGAFGSSPGVNLKSHRKLRTIDEITRSAPFTYAGDSAADLPIWKVSAASILVNPSRRVLKAVEQFERPSQVLVDRISQKKLLWKLVRPHQWVKNFLVFVPVVAAHRFLDFRQWGLGFLAFAAFSGLASCIYVMNDILDVQADRMHSKKRRRPLASGELPLKTGLVFLPALACVTAFMISFLPWRFAMVAIAYVSLNLIYSFKLKQKVILDVLLLGSFYSLRIIAGGYATSTLISSWLLSFSTFFFFGLAMVKRYTEVRSLPQNTGNPYGRGYQSDDAMPVFVLGAGSSLMAVLVLSLYFNSPDIKMLYHSEQRLWLIVPILLFWTSRIWILAHRGVVNDDPVVFALRDRVSWFVGAAFFIVMLLST